MSHIVSIRTQIRDATAVRTACQRLGLTEPVEGTTRLYSGEVSGLAIRLRGWKYPVIASLQSGELKYDNFNGLWGDAKQLDKFLQAYAVERAKAEARRKGHAVTEQQLVDGSIKVTIQVGQGGAA